MAAAPINRDLTLEQLERDAWSDPTFQSYLVVTCHTLRKKRLRDFTTEDLRIMLGQDIGVRYLLPIAIEVLRADPLAAGDMYPGDLLKAAIGCNILAAENPHEAAVALDEIADCALERLARSDRRTAEDLSAELRDGSARMRTLRDQTG